MDHGFSMGGDGVPYPLTSAAMAFDLEWERRQNNDVDRRESRPASANSTSTSFKLALAAALPLSANAFLTKSVSHGTTWFTVGSIVMGIILLLSLSKIHSSRPLSKRLNSQAMFSLTFTGILAVVAIFEVE